MNHVTTFETVVAIFCGAVAFCLASYLILKWLAKGEDAEKSKIQREREFINSKPK